MNGWNVLLVVLVVLAVAYASALTIDVAALRGSLEEANAEIEDLTGQLATQKTELERAIEDKIAAENQPPPAGCLAPIPVSSGAGSAQPSAADEAASGRVSRLLVILPAMAVNLAWLSGVVIHRVYANATRNTRRMRLTLEEAEAIRLLREQKR